MPERLQRRRTLGYRLPAGAIYVGRPSRYGNPYEVAVFGLSLALELFENSASGFWTPAAVVRAEEERGVALLDEAYEAHHDYLGRFTGHPLEALRSDLRGHDVACWCPLPEPGEPDICHGAVLLALANR